MAAATSRARVGHHTDDRVRQGVATPDRRLESGEDRADAAFKAAQVGAPCGRWTQRPDKSSPTPVSVPTARCLGFPTGPVTASVWTVTSGPGLSAATKHRSRPACVSAVNPWSPSMASSVSGRKLPIHHGVRGEILHSTEPGHRQALRIVVKCRVGVQGAKCRAVHAPVQPARRTAHQAVSTSARRTDARASHSTLHPALCTRTLHVP